VSVWALTGAAPNKLHSLASEAIAIQHGGSATVQEIHLVVVHLLCNSVEEAIKRRAEHHQEAV
jgi:D-sedoheptulose 7-phosphate isomerase